MKKIPAVFCFILCSVLLCSCSQINQNYADELKASVWHTVNKSTTEVTLSFSEDNKAEINIKGDSDNTCVISGICAVNESSFVISDVSMAKNISIDYKLYGNKVELTYMGSTLTLEKTDSEKS